MKKSKSSRLIAAVAMLTVSAVALTTASYAWFTMQKEVSATGLTLTATSPTGLLISNAENGVYGTTTVMSVEGVKKMVPISGPDYVVENPTNLFFANKNTQNGIIDDFTKSTFSAIPGKQDTARQYYVDTSVWIKSSAALDPGTTINIKLADLNIVGPVGDEASSLSNAYRVASNGKIFADKLAIRTWTPLASATTLGTALTTSVKDSADTVISTISSESPVQIKLRVWLEGQDEDCITLAAATNVTIDLKLEGIDVLTPAP